MGRLLRGVALEMPGVALGDLQQREILAFLEHARDQSPINVGFDRVDRHRVLANAPSKVIPRRLRVGLTDLGRVDSGESDLQSSTLCGSDGERITIGDVFDPRSESLGRNDPG